jgi:hypothetical protein
MVMRSASLAQSDYTVDVPHLPPGRVPRAHEVQRRSGRARKIRRSLNSWVPRNAFDEPLKKCTANNDPTFNPQQDQIWAAFDKALAR